MDRSTYKTPAPTPAPGVPFTVDASTPTLFTPVTFRGLTLGNRIFVAPMCTYSSHDGSVQDFHLVHLGGYAMRGASLTIVEATAVQPRGRITPGCPGLWKDEQIAPLKRVADYIHGQGHAIGIQLAHAGRKASTLPPWEAEALVGRGRAVVCSNDRGGWEGDVWGPSTQPYGPGCVEDVHAMTIEEIKQTVQDFASAARRAVAAGIDVIEIHGAHGYMISSFLSPLSNTRTDQYGGKPFENRIRFLMETITAIREVIPETMPLFLRISATEWFEGGWDVEESIALAKLLPGVGVDLLDVSSGGNSAGQKIEMHNGYQVGIAGRIRASLHEAGINNLAIGAVGLITQAQPAASIVELPTPPNGTVETGASEKVDGAEGTNGVDGVMLKKAPLTFETEHGGQTQADIVLVARQFLREPEWVLRVAHQLGVDVSWPVQYARAKWSERVTLGLETRKEESKI